MMGPGEGTWQCHVCGAVRPDRVIRVHKDSTPIANGRSEMTVAVRFCSDRRKCREGAPHVARRWLNPWRTPGARTSPNSA